MTEVLNVPLGPSQETQIDPGLSQNGALYPGVQSIVTQPVSSFHEVPEMAQEEEEEERKKRRDDDCCCAAYDDDDVFFLVRCFAWCCVQIARCSESCCEGCADGINSCCESNDTGNSGEGCCFGGCDCCDDCDGCDCDCSD